jgi:hypothetical protein
MYRTSQMKEKESMKKKQVTFSKSPNTHLGEERWRSRSSDKAEEILQLYLTGRHSDCVFEIQFGMTDEAVVMVLNLLYSI